MKVSLIFPHVFHDTLGDFTYLPKLFSKRTPEGRFSSLLTIPLALPTLAALTPQDVEVRVVDEAIDGIDYDEEVDVVGLSFYSTLAPRAYEIADEFRKRGVHVCAGGAHPTFAADEAAQHADSVFIGEAEDTWPEFIRDFQRGQPKKVYRCEKRPDLQALLIPRWDLVKTEYYQSFQVQTTRGCPRDCEFCSAKALSGELRIKPVEHVVAEVKALKERVGAKFAPLNITFSDDDITANRAHAKKLFQALIPLKIRWWSECSVLIAKDEELLDLAAKSGCDFLLLGMESVSQEAQDEVGKGKLNKVSEFKEIIRKIQAHGISVLPGIIFGFDSDDTSVFQRTVDFIQESGADFPMFNILTPYIGTRLLERLRQENRLRPFALHELDSYHVLHTPKKMTPEQLVEGHRWAILQTYSYEGACKRLDVACSNGSIDLRNSTLADQMFRMYATYVLLKEALTQDKEMRQFITKILKVMWSRRSAKTLALLMLLDRFDFVHQAQKKQAGATGATAAPAAAA